MGKIARMCAAIAIVIVVCFVGYTHTQASSVKLERMIQVLEANGASVEEWSWLAKGEEQSVQDVHTFQELLRRLEENGIGANWQWEQSAQGYKATSIKKLPDYTERTVVTWMNVNNKHKTFIIYEAKGSIWDKEIIEKTSRIFSQKPTIFTCVRGVLNDNMEGVLLNKATDIINHLSATPVESVQERAFVSVSAYTEEWKDALTVNREKMNVQVALRKTENKTTVVVGTPIITSEY